MIAIADSVWDCKRKSGFLPNMTKKKLMMMVSSVKIVQAFYHYFRSSGQREEEVMTIVRLWSETQEHKGGQIWITIGQNP